MQLLDPIFLVLALAALLPWIGPLRTGDRRHALLRSVALLLVAAALARPARVVTDPAEHRVLVLDRSASVTESEDERARGLVRQELAAEGAARATWSIVEVGGAERPELELPASVRRIRVEPEARDATPLGAALDAAVRALPPGGAQRVTLFTDGLSTGDRLGADRGHALRALAARGVPLDVVALDGAAGDLRPVGLEAAGTSRVGIVTELVARVVGGGQVVTCRLVGPGGELDRAESVVVDGEVAVPLSFEPDAAGFLDLALEVEVESGVDPRPGDGRLERTLCVQDALRVLYMGERVAGGGERLAQLVGRGFDVRVGTDDVGESDLDAADLVVLDDRPAKSVPEALQEALVQRVAAGGIGFVAAGGEAAFGPGGFHDAPIERMLPVEFVQKEEKRDPSTTLVVIIDTSGSMGGNRVQLAKEVARLAIRRLLPHDKVGMVEFYGAKRWAVPIQPASNSIEIERALNRLDAGGGTVILPAIEEAYYGLKNVRTRYKHVLILTDGGVETGAFEPLVRRMAQDGMTVSTVLIGPDAHSEFLVGISNWGQGRFYSVPNRFNLPEILLKQPASAKLPAYRPGTVNLRARGGPAWWGEVDPGSTPPVAGYVETRARPGAERVLETEEEGHPVLASWRYGLGRVSALTTEPTGPGTEPWQDWDGYGEVLGRVLARTAADTSAPFAFEVVREPGGACVVAERRAGPADLVPRAETVADDAGARESLPFARVAPDRFEARVLLDARSSLRLEAAAGRQGSDALVGPRTRLALDPLAGVARERQVAPEAATRFTNALAAVAPDGGSAAVRTRLREFGPLLALLALLVYLADVTYRRRPTS
ncbi:MAG: VWA domain-containing protein [Planctomycetota bacterium]